MFLCLVLRSVHVSCFRCFLFLCSEFRDYDFLFLLIVRVSCLYVIAGLSVCLIYLFMCLYLCSVRVLFVGLRLSVVLLCLSVSLC